MADDSLIFSCSPTLAGIKVGNLFNYKFTDTNEMRTCVRNWNKMLRRKGIVVLPLNYKEGRTLIYMYRPDKLKSKWSNGIAQKILSERGYDTESVKKSILHLQKRIAVNGSFPHEIGLFLDYPAEDVKGFIDHKAQNYKITGLWKVYNNVEYAEKTFEKYNHCKRIYMKRFANGETIEQLAVAN